MDNLFKLFRSRANPNEIKKEHVVWEDSFGTPEDFRSYALNAEPKFETDGEHVWVRSMDNHDRAIGTPIMMAHRKDLKEIDFKNFGATMTNVTSDVDPNILIRVPKTTYLHVDGMPMGLLDFRWAEHDHYTQKKLKSLGVRTHESIGVIPLTEIFINGERCPIKRRGQVRVAVFPDGREHVFPKGFVPAQQIRAWGTAYRVQDIWKPDEENSSGELFNKQKLEQAIEIVRLELTQNGELKSGEVFGPKEYLMWFAKNLGKNLAKMHQGGYTHRYLHWGNITLDCRLTDFDSVVDMRTRKKQLEKFFSEKGQEDKNINLELFQDFFSDLDCKKFGNTPDVTENTRTGVSTVESLKNLHDAIGKEFDLKLEPDFLEKMTEEYYRSYQDESDGLIQFYDEDGKLRDQPLYSGRRMAKILKML